MTLQGIEEHHLFAIDELIVRVRALAGRLQTQEFAETVYRIGRYEFIPTSKVLRIDQSETILP